MIQAIGLMVGMYILTRMAVLLGRTGDREENAIAKSAFEKIGAN